MSEAPAIPISPSPNPLRELHGKTNAEFQAYATTEIVSTFGEPQAEYAAIRKMAGLMDEPQRGILELTGADRLSFLNNLLTNQTWDKATKSGLTAGQGVYAFFLNGKGRVVTDVFVIERGDRTWLDMDARLVDSTRQAFDKFLFREQVKMTSRVGTLHSIALHGPGAAKLLAEICRTTDSLTPLTPLTPSPGTPGEGGGEGLPTNDANSPQPNPLPAYREREQEASALAPVGSFATRMFDVDVVIWRDDPCSVPGFHLIVDTADAEKIWTGFLSQFFENEEPGRRRLRPIGWAAFNAARIEGGRPIFGIDFDDSVLPAETGQFARAVSITKGCYLGQEIVARMHARGQVARQIVGLRVTDDALPIAGTLLYDDHDNQVGGITSSTVSPVLSNACLCLGLVKKPFIPLGSVVNVPAEGSMRKATVVELPFVKPMTV